MARGQVAALLKGSSWRVHPAPLRDFEGLGWMHLAQKKKKLFFFFFLLAHVSVILTSAINRNSHSRRKRATLRSKVLSSV